MKAAEGDLAGGTDLRESFKFLLGDVTNGKNHLRNRIYLKDVLQGVERPKDWNTIDLFALISKIIINESNRF